MGKEKVVKNMDTSAFDWTSTHQHFGSPLHAILFGRVSTSGSYPDLISDISKGIRSRLGLLRIAMERGANPYVAAPASCDACRNWCYGDEETEAVQFAGRSTFECLWACERVIRQMDSDNWLDEIGALDEAAEILAKPNHTTSSGSVLVSEGLLEMWESIYSDVESADVILKVVAPDKLDAGSVCAHSVILRGASPVLKAMLATGMREGDRKEIEVSDCSEEALHFLLSLLYTGSISSTEESTQEPPASIMLCALNLAHRWQVGHVVRMLVLALAQRIDMDNFDVLADTALRLQLGPLLTSCRSFIAGHARELRCRLLSTGTTGRIQSPAVRAEVESILSGTACAAGETPRRKRRRTF